MTSGIYNKAQAKGNRQTVTRLKEITCRPVWFLRLQRENPRSEKPLQIMYIVHETEFRKVHPKPRWYIARQALNSELSPFTKILNTTAKIAPNSEISLFTRKLTEYSFKKHNQAESPHTRPELKLISGELRLNRCQARSLSRGSQWRNWRTRTKIGHAEHLSWP